MDEELVIQALSRPAFLGEVYDASSGQLLNTSLFKEDDLKPPVTVTTQIPRTEVEFKIVNSTEDRAHLLGVSAEVSVSILGGLGGAGEFKGFGSYLDRSDSSKESITITAVVRLRTIHRRLDLSNDILQKSKALDDDQIQGLRATHVVTGITYGGTLLATFTETKSRSNAAKELKGDFSLSVMQKLAAFAGAEGKIKLENTDVQDLNRHELDVSLITDSSDPDLQVPTTREDIILAIERGLPKLSSTPSNVSERGVPLELILTPISRFDQFSIVLLLRELAETDLIRMRKLYDSIMTLHQQRNTMLLEIEKNLPGRRVSCAAIFPTFFDRCQERYGAVKKILTLMRGSYGQFLLDYRRNVDTNNVTAGSLITENTAKYTTEEKLYAADLIEWQVRRQQFNLAQEHGYPLSTTLEMADYQDGVNSLIVVLLPEKATKIKLLDSYRIIGDDIRKWLPTQLKSIPTAPGGASVYTSFYADPASDADLMRLDSRTGNLKVALQTVRETSQALFLLYGSKKGSVSGFDWFILGRDYWDSWVDPKSQTRYTGNVKDGVPHGDGRMTYVDGTYYLGNWFFGKRDGYGKLVRVVDAASSNQSSLNGEQILHDGKWLNNKPIRNDEDIMSNNSGPDGFQQWRIDFANTCVVEVIVIHSGGNVFATSTFCLPINDRNHTQVEKIAAAFGWKEGQRHELTPFWETDQGDGRQEFDSPYKIISNGSRIEAGPYEEGHVEEWAWPDDEVALNGGPLKRLSMYYFVKWSIDLGPTTFQQPPLKIRAFKLN